MNKDSIFSVVKADGNQMLSCDECECKSKQVVSITLSGESATGFPWDEPEGDREVHFCKQCLKLAADLLQPIP